MPATAPSPSACEKGTARVPKAKARETMVEERIERVVRVGAIRAT